MVRCLLTVVLCSLEVAAFAQVPKDTAKDSLKPDITAVPTIPERTTASFGDWVLRCDASPKLAQRVCEVAQAMTVQGQTAPIAQIAVGRVTRSDPIRLTLVLPTNVAFGTKPKVIGDKTDKSPTELTWDRCLPSGCIASAKVAEDVMTRLSRLTEPGSIVFQDAAERVVALPISFRGLLQALTALSNEP